MNGYELERYLRGLRDGHLAVLNSPVPPGSGSYAMFGEPWGAPDDREDRELARRWADGRSVRCDVDPPGFERGQRAYWLGHARGIRATPWRA